MFILIVSGSVLSGGMIPVDPNGVGGPPTLPPYYGANGGMDEQQIVLPSGALTPDPKGNLQLKTFKVNVCGKNTVVDFLIDTSTSMKFDGKMDKTKAALTAFTKKMTSTSVIGIQTFSAKADERVHLDYYNKQAGQVSAVIQGLDANGWTVTRDGFELAKQSISDAITSGKFPSYHYALVLISDGVPEIPPDQHPNCEAKATEPALAPADRCFAKEQDPRPNDVIQTDIPKDLKALGVEIYSVGIYSPTFPSDVALKPNLEAMLKEVASLPSNTHYFDSYQGTNLDQILNLIFTSMCAPIDEVPGADVQKDVMGY